MNFIGISRPIFQPPDVPGHDFFKVLRLGVPDPSFFNFTPKPVREMCEISGTTIFPYVF